MNCMCLLTNFHMMSPEADMTVKENTDREIKDIKTLPSCQYLNVQLETLNTSPSVALLKRTSLNKTEQRSAVIMTSSGGVACMCGTPHVTVSSGAYVCEASVQVYQCDVVYDHPSSCLTAFGRLKANNKCKLQSGADRSWKSIIAPLWLCVCVCVCRCVRLV